MTSSTGEAQLMRPLCEFPKKGVWRSFVARVVLLSVTMGNWAALIKGPRMRVGRLTRTLPGLLAKI